MKYPGLELTRFIAALAVVVFHFQFFFVPFTDGWDQASLPMSSVFWPAYQYGHLAVPCFWALSGFIFFMRYKGTIESRGVDLRTFALRRVARLYPLHILTLVLTAILFYAYRSLLKQDYWLYAPTSNVGAFVANLFMASNWFSADYRFNGPIWSVSIEVLIYALFFALSWTIKPGRGHAKTACILLSALAAYWLAKRFGPIPLELACQSASCFYLGGVIYEIRSEDTPSHARILWSLFFGLSAAALLYRPAYFQEIFLAGGVLIASTNNRFGNYAAGASWLGNLTYSSYLLHFPVALVVVTALQYSGLSPNLDQSTALLLAYVAAVFLLSWVSYRAFEGPARRLISGIRR